MLDFSPGKYRLQIWVEQERKVSKLKWEHTVFISPEQIAVAKYRRTDIIFAWSPSEKDYIGVAK